MGFESVYLLMQSLAISNDSAIDCAVSTHLPITRLPAGLSIE